MSVHRHGSDKDQMPPEMPPAEESLNNEETAGAADKTSARQQQDSEALKRRPYMAKFATIHTDKYAQNLRREFPMTNFDRNLTVEKARFDPQPNEHKESSSPPHEHQQQQLQPSSSPPTITPNSITPSASSNGIHTPSSTFSAANAKPSRPPAKSKSEGDRAARAVKKRRRPPPPMSGTATPAEVFHRNLIDAVSNVEDSDENEHYVYSYGGTAIDHASYHSDLVYRPQSIRSTPASPMHDPRRINPLSRTSSFFGDLFRSLRSQQAAVADEEENPSQPHRPKLRSNVMDHRPKQLQASDTWEPHHWYDNKHSIRTPQLMSLPPQAPLPPRHRQRIYPEAYHTDGYSSDDEGASLLMRRSARLRQRAKKRPWPIVRNVLFGVVLAVLGLMFLMLYKAKPLTDISVEMGRVLASDKELIFDLKVKANNWNWWTVRVADADISLFAFSQVVPMSNDSNDTTARGVDPAEYLGSFYRFDEPLSFSPAMLSHETFEASSQIRIKSPGADKSGNQRWSRIIRYPYGLVARGVLKYRPLPLGSFYPQSAAICDVARVEPISGVVSEDPDQSYCLKDGKKLITD